MTRPVLHYAVDGTWFDYDAGRYEQVPCCGNDFRRTKKLTDDWREVTCRKCMTLCGFDAVPAEQLTECVSDPIRRAA